MEIKIGKIYVNEHKKDGSPYLGRDGEILHNVVIKPLDGQYAGQYITNLCVPSEVPAWRAGSVINVDVVPKGAYLNWKIPKNNPGTSGDLAPRMTNIEARLNRLEAIAGVDHTGARTVEYGDPNERAMKENIAKMDSEPKKDNMDDLPF